MNNHENLFFAPCMSYLILSEQFEESMTKLNIEEGNMTEINITEMTKRPREIFTAQFDRYDFDRRFKRIYFKNVKNDKGVLIKERFWISKKKGKEHNLIGNMFENEIIFFSAEIEMNAKYEDGFKLVRPIVLIKKK